MADLYQLFSGEMNEPADMAQQADYSPPAQYPEGDDFESMRILSENVPAGVALMQDGRLLFVNRTFCTMFGYSDPSEMINKPSKSLLAKEERSRHVRMLEGLSQSGPTGARFQWTGINRDGRKFWFEGRPVPIEWHGRPAVLSFVMDITEYKQREESMERESDVLRAENTKLRTSIDYRVRLGNIIGRSCKMQVVFEAILRAASSDFSVVISGETGTGKEMVTKAVHELSGRGKGPFVPVNCGAIPAELFESEFFGHRKGSFTGAHADRPGYLDQAKGGSIFLDEIGEISATGQVKLLRALGSGEYTAVGSSRATKTDFRVIAATNRDLEEMVRQGQFRSDLFYRIHVIPILLPPLRERKEDIPFLVEHILTRRLGTENRMTSQDLARLLEHDWPGNVRELHNVLERYSAFGHLDFMRSEDHASARQDVETLAEEGDLRSNMARLEARLIVQSLDKYDWNRAQTAAALGLPRKTLFRKMQKLGIHRREKCD